HIPGGDSLALPAVVVGLVILLFIFFCYASALLYWKSRRLQARLKRIIGALKKERKVPGELDRAKLNRLGEILGKDTLCAHGWSEFTETLVVDKSDSRERFFNTRQAEEFFSEAEIVEEAMHPNFFRAVPALLTSIGLLGTFIAILLGLAVIHVPEGSAPGKI